MSVQFAFVYGSVFLSVLWLNACLVVCVKEVDVALPDWPSAVLYDGSQSICCCRQEL